ncbi:MAG: hypothetical protein J2P37_15190 [Ktedonobacteraceae bacterium]|nr:hypothetical protein [Ktedonobacteraceae bacterium]
MLFITEDGQQARIQAHPWVLAQRGGHLIATQGITELSGTSQTALSKMLTPPSHPILHYRIRNGGALALIFTGIAGMVVFGYMGITFLEVIIIAQLAKFMAVILITLVLFLLLSIGAIIRGIILNNRAEAAKKARIAAEVPHWKQAMANWDSLYYCSRDDIVFFPGDNTRYAPPELLHTLL